MEFFGVFAIWYIMFFLWPRLDKQDEAIKSLEKRVKELENEL